MKQVKGFWLPDTEEHLVPFLKNGQEYFNGPTYQLTKLLACNPFIKRRRHAVDVGAHCGLWARPLSHSFTNVTAFEPVESHRECLLANIAQFQRHNIYVHACALGAHIGDVSLHSGPSSSGDTYVQEGGEHKARMITLDSIGLTDVDFLKIDCEGYELHVIEGGEKTILRDQPCIIVEQKPGKAKQFGLGDIDAVKRLQSWGAVLRKEISGDFIMSWD